MKVRFKLELPLFALIFQKKVEESTVEVKTGGSFVFV